jgi:hypothetical protein
MIYALGRAVMRMCITRQSATNGSLPAPHEDKKSASIKILRFLDVPAELGNKIYERIYASHALEDGVAIPLVLPKRKKRLRFGHAAGRGPLAILCQQANPRRGSGEFLA